MVEILPAIIEDTFTEVRKKIELAAPFVTWVQVDVADGVFVPRATWTRIEDMNTLDEGHRGGEAGRREVRIDLHAMVADPMSFIERAQGIKRISRITFHYESVRNHEEVIRAIKAIGREAGIAVNPETSIEQVVRLLPSTDALLVMGVHPGWGGQSFIPETCDKIRAFRKAIPEAVIGADGGIHLATGSAQAAMEAGADYLVVGSDIFGAAHPGEMIQRLQRLTPIGIN